MATSADRGANGRADTAPARLAKTLAAGTTASLALRRREQHVGYPRGIGLATVRAAAIELRRGGACPPPAAARSARRRHRDDSVQLGGTDHPYRTPIRHVRLPVRAVALHRNSRVRCIRPTVSRI